MPTSTTGPPAAPPDQPAVVLSAHLDDAVLSCWSVLAGDGEVTVLNVFSALPRAGEPVSDWGLVTRAGNARERAQQRIEEDRRALAVAGRSAVNLDVADDQVAARADGRWPLWARAASRVAPSHVAGRRRRQRLEATLERVAEHVPRGATVYAPAGIGHPDHTLLGDIGWRLMGAGRRVTFYADQPYCHSLGWPHWVTGAEPEPMLDVEAAWRPYLERDGIELARLAAHVTRLDDRGWAQKLRAMRCYASQFAALEAGPLRRLSNRELTGHELFWRDSRGGGETG